MSSTPASVQSASIDSLAEDMRKHTPPGAMRTAEHCGMRSQAASQSGRSKQTAPGTLKEELQPRVPAAPQVVFPRQHLFAQKCCAICESASSMTSAAALPGQVLPEATVGYTAVRGAFRTRCV